MAMNNYLNIFLEWISRSSVIFSLISLCIEHTQDLILLVLVSKCLKNISSFTTDKETWHFSIVLFKCLIGKLTRLKCLHIIYAFIKVPCYQMELFISWSHLENLVLSNGISSRYLRYCLCNI